jgi:hypothetical protein
LILLKMHYSHLINQLLAVHGVTHELTAVAPLPTRRGRN